MPARDEAGSHRRNGKPASCEPCRKGKIACDHRRPHCTRCQRRGLESRCFYHPAPLTKARGSVAAPSAANIVSPSSSNDGSVVASLGPVRLHYASVALGQRGGSSGAGEIGQRLYASRLDNTGRAECLTIISDLLEGLHPLDLIQKLISAYYATSQTALVPGPLILAAISNYPTLASSHSGTAGSDTSVFAENVLNATLEEVIVTRSTGLIDFCAQFYGKKLRLETIGILYTIAARACMFGLSRDDCDRKCFIQAMHRGSNTCLRLARDIAPQVNDALVWLEFENMRLTDSINGEGDHEVWRILGELSTDALALGIHREAVNSSLPFFLAECRRRTFVAAYHWDKNLAGQFDLPPRILRRYSDCFMPLDLADDELYAPDPLEAERARLALSEDGWSVNGTYSSSTWTRIRFMLAQSREQIMEHSYHNLDAEMVEKLKNFAQRCQQDWQSLPHHLHYKSSCWTSESATVCIMLVFVQLWRLQNDFHIQRLLEKHDPAATSASLQIAAEIMTIVLTTGKNRDRAVFLVEDFANVVLAYGLTSAAALATALQTQSKTLTSLLPPNLSRSSLVRNLSVFVSHLESICGPGEANYAICTNAAKTISRALDEAIDTPASGGSGGSGAGNLPPTPASGSNYVEIGNDNVSSSHAASQDFMDGIDMSGFEGLGDVDGGFGEMDPDVWLKGIDWTNLGSEWTTF